MNLQNISTRQSAASAEKLLFIGKQLKDLAEELSLLDKLCTKTRIQIATAQTAALRSDINAILGKSLGGKQHRVEQQACIKLIDSNGPVAFIKKALWGQDIDSLALSVAIESVTPEITQLVSIYPALLLDDAREAIAAAITK